MIDDTLWSKKKLRKQQTKAGPDFGTSPMPTDKAGCIGGATLTE